MLTLTLWRTYRSGRREEHPWPALIDRLGVRDPEVVRNKKQVAGYSLGAFVGNRRALARVERVHALVLDLDRGAPTVEAVARALPNTRGVVYTTFSHTPEAPRLRAIFPHARPVTVEEHDQIWAWAKLKCSAAAKLELDHGSRDASHLFFLPSHRPGAEYRWQELEGRPIDVNAVLREAPERARPPQLVLPAESGPTAREQQLGGLLGPADMSGSGHDFRFCLRLMREGADDEEVLEALAAHPPQGKQGLKPSYLEATVESARAVHETHAPVMRVTRATLHRLPPRFGHPERTHVKLELESDDGERADATIVVPREPGVPAATTWQACFPDVAPDRLLVPWEEVDQAWRAMRCRRRRFEVAVRNGEVRWIRAADRA